jgi:hypothetical protein
MLRAQITMRFWSQSTTSKYLRKPSTDWRSIRRFGAASRMLVEREFSSQRIGRDLIALYRGMLARKGGVSGCAS